MHFINCFEIVVRVLAFWAHVTSFVPIFFARINVVLNFKSKFDLRWISVIYRLFALVWRARPFLGTYQTFTEYLFATVIWQF